MAPRYDLARLDHGVFKGAIVGSAEESLGERWTSSSILSWDSFECWLERGVCGKLPLGGSLCPEACAESVRCVCGDKSHYMTKARSSHWLYGKLMSDFVD